MKREYIERSAVVSPCGYYRYRLFRKWNARPQRLAPMLWVMLNPSTADGTEDDATIRRCVAFADSWGYGSMWVGNIFAYRSTDPKRMPIDEYARQGPENHKHLDEMGAQSELIVLGYGSNGYRSLRTLGALYARELWCLGETKDGRPKHPLYLAASTPLQRWA